MANNLRYQEIEKIGYGKARVGAAVADEDAVDEIAANENELNELGMAPIGEDYDDGDPYGDEYEEQ